MRLFARLVTYVVTLDEDDARRKREDYERGYKEKCLEIERTRSVFGGGLPLNSYRQVIVAELFLVVVGIVALHPVDYFPRTSEEAIMWSLTIAWLLFILNFAHTSAEATLRNHGL